MGPFVAFTVLAAMLAAGSVTPMRAWSQAPDRVQEVDKRLVEKQAMAEAHRKQMEGIKDPDQLSVEMRRHFQMTEEMLALMLERKKLTEAHAPAPAQPPAATAAPGGGMQGGMMEHGMGRMGGMQGGGMQGRGMQGGMMGKEMGGMQGGGMTQKDNSGMPGMGGSASPQSTPGPAATTPSSGDMGQMMQRIAEHSTYMETIQDRGTLAQEMLRHQKMLDQMLQLMQQ
jgi:hypothetical protein